MSIILYKAIPAEKKFIFSAGVFTLPYVTLAYFLSFLLYVLNFYYMLKVGFKQIIMKKCDLFCMSK